VDSKLLLWKLQDVVRVALLVPATMGVLACSGRPSEGDLEAASRELYGKEGCIPRNTFGYGQDQCDYIVLTSLPCGVPTGVSPPKELEATQPGEAICTKLCLDFGEHECSITQSETGTQLVCSDSSDRPRTGCPVPGRRPAVERAVVAEGASPEARWLSQAAQHEWLSVDAFLQLSAELEQLGAPRSLVHRARRAAAEERAHGAQLARLGRRYGVDARRPRRALAPCRGALEVALDNLVEGCIHETFSALVMTYQSAKAEDPQARRAFAAIAREEASHAALSRDIHRWVSSALSPAQREAIEDRRRSAYQKLPALLAQWDRPASRALGAPSNAEVSTLGTLFLSTPSLLV
jgi:hypothetical protein